MCSTHSQYVSPSPRLTLPVMTAGEGIPAGRDHCSLPEHPPASQWQNWADTMQPTVKPTFMPDLHIQQEHLAPSGKMSFSVT